MNTDNIESIIEKLNAARMDKKAAEKIEKTCLEKLAEIMQNNKTIETENYIVIVKETVSVRIDTKKLYHDFTEQEIKKNYGKETVSRSVIVAEKEQEKKTA